MELFWAAARLVTEMAFWSRAFSQLNFIRKPPCAQGRGNREETGALVRKGESRSFLKRKEMILEAVAVGGRFCGKREESQEWQAFPPPQPAVEKRRGSPRSLSKEILSTEKFSFSTGIVEKCPLKRVLWIF
jgi:hypothetical protein